MPRTGELKAVVDDRVCHEYKDVLLRPEFGFPPSDVDILLDQIMSNAYFPEISADDIIENMKDSGDIPFAECALAARCPMVTGNLRHFKHPCLRSATVLSASEFLKLVSGGRRGR